jgi:hypothetical protein
VWFCRRVAAEIGAEPVRRSGDLEICSFDGWLIVGAEGLEDGRAGSFMLHDIIGGHTYRLPVFCHEQLDPPGWYPLTLAIQSGLNPAAAYDVAGLDALKLKPLPRWQATPVPACRRVTDRREYGCHA